MNNSLKLALSIVAAFSFISCIFGTLAYFKAYNLNETCCLFVCLLFALFYFIALYLINKEV